MATRKTRRRGLLIKSMLRAGIIFGIALALAFVSGSMSLAKTIERERPETAIALPGHSGFAEAAAARRIIGAGRIVAGQRTLTLEPALIESANALSLNALRSEPLSNQALANLAFLAEAQGDTEAAQKLMFAAASLTSRELDINSWILEYYVGQQDALQALETYDLILRSSEGARAASIPIVVQFLANAELVAPMTDLLNVRPPWEVQFWNEAYKFEPALSNVAQVRINLAKEGFVSTPRNDQLLMDALVKAGQFTQAEELYRVFAQLPSDPTKFVNNGDFDRASDFAPFDWELYFDNFFSATIEPATKRLRIETFADGNGLLARNLVRLEGQEFDLKVSAAQWDELDPDAVYFRIRCAEDGTQAGDAARIYLDQAELDLTFRKANPSCTYHWLEILARAQPQQRDNIILLENVSILPSR